MKIFKKDLVVTQVKSATTPSDDQLAVINKFTRRTYEAKELYILKLAMAHNGIDLDEERFNESMLKDFAETGIGKVFMTDHEKKVKAVRGLFFGSEVQVMSPPEFKALTDEEIVLPEGVKDAHVVLMDVYIPRAGIDEKELALIDAGVIRFVSIGFSASGLKSVKDSKGIAYKEYTGRGKMREGSLVWLGAQPGAGVINKDAGGDDNDPPSDGKKEDEKDMEIFAKMAAICGKRIKDEEEALGFTKELMNEVKTLKEEATTLKAFAEDGKAYRKGLIDEAVRLSVMVGKCDRTPEAGEKEAAFLASWPLDRLQAEKKALEAQAREKFPTEFTIPATTGKDKTSTTAGERLLDRCKAMAEAASGKKG